MVLAAVVLVLGSAGIPAARAQTADQPLNQRQAYCLQLEQQLARDWQLSQDNRNALPRIEQDMRKYDRVYQTTQAKAEQSGCYEYFLFSKTLRETPQCLRMQRQIDDARRRLAALEQQREKAEVQNRLGNQQEAIVAELARYGCGPQYQQAARSSSPFGFWDDSEGADPGLTPYGQQAYPYATYRTVCVRQCDGYFFPISYATLPAQFEKDAAACSAQCAAPAELFVYQNPGGQVEQATSLAGEPISKIPNAFRYRKEFVQGCSCKVTEYAPDGKTPALQQQGDAAPAAPAEATAAVDVQELAPVAADPASPSPAEPPAEPAAATAAAPEAGDDAIQALLDGEQQWGTTTTTPQ